MQALLVCFSFLFFVVANVVAVAIIINVVVVVLVVVIVRYGVRQKCILN